MLYHYLRVFLIETEQPPVLVETGDIEPRPERPAYLQKLFSSRVDFQHRKSLYVYQPIGQQTMEDGVVCLGRLGRQITEVGNEPPERNFAEREETKWRAANVLVDTRSSEEGQKVAFEYRPDVGKPLALFSSLVDHLNEANPDSGWWMEVNVIPEVGSFWDAARKHRGEITAVEFTFVTPNVLKMRTQLNEDLKSARKNHNAQRVRIGMDNKKGNLELEGDDVKDAVDYIQEGGGSAKLKAGRKTVYDSEKAEQTAEVDEDEPLNVQKKSTWSKFIGNLFS